MKKYVSLILMICALNVQAEDFGVDKRCLVSSDGKIKMRLVWVSTSGWVGGYVQYGEKKEKISIVETQYEELVDEGYQSSVKSEWVEIIDGEKNGKYYFGYQGALINGASYTNKKGKKFDFLEADDSYETCFSPRK